MNNVNSVNPEPPPESSAHPTMQALARRWNVRRQDLWDAARELGIPSAMGARVTAANERRLQDRLFVQTVRTRALAAVPPPMPINERDNNSAYLAATSAKAERLARAAEAERADVDLCTCCEIPLPRNHDDSQTVCHDCLTHGHREVNGRNRDLLLARMHVERFRSEYLRQQERATNADRDRQAADGRADRWRNALVRTVVDHNRDGKHCPICKTPAPCAVWRRLERANPGIAEKVLNVYYPLSESKLDEKLAGG